jgi:hypothetical protein
MTSCQSVKVVYVDKYITPDYDMPIFPKLEREVHPDGSWTVPKESTDLLAEFYIKYDMLVKLYNHDKELYDQLKNNNKE